MFHQYNLNLFGIFTSKAYKVRIGEEDQAGPTVDNVSQASTL